MARVRKLNTYFNKEFFDIMEFPPLSASHAQHIFKQTPKGSKKAQLNAQLLFNSIGVKFILTR
jgi:hypothetical protein